MKSVTTTIITGFLIVIGSSVVQAQGYVGGSVGATAMVPTVAEGSINDWNAVVYGPGNDCDSLNCYSEQDNSGGIKFFGGYRVNPYFAVEGFYAYLGEFDSYADDGWGVDSFATADVETLGVAAVGHIPLGSGRVSLMGKLGFHSWSAEGTIDLWDTAAGAGFVGSYDESGTDVMGGIGVEIGFGENAAMRVEYEYFAATTDYTDYGVGMISVGGIYKF